MVSDMLVAVYNVIEVNNCEDACLAMKSADERHQRLIIKNIRGSSRQFWKRRTVSMSTGRSSYRADENYYLTRFITLVLASVTL